jgi:hypothetical protein
MLWLRRSAAPNKSSSCQRETLRVLKRSPRASSHTTDMNLLKLSMDSLDNVLRSAPLMAGQPRVACVGLLLNRWLAQPERSVAMVS